MMVCTEIIYIYFWYRFDRIHIIELWTTTHLKQKRATLNFVKYHFQQWHLFFCWSPFHRYLLKQIWTVLQYPNSMLTVICISNTYEVHDNQHLSYPDHITHFHRFIINLALLLSAIFLNAHVAHMRISWDVLEFIIVIPCNFGIYF